MGESNKTAAAGITITDNNSVISTAQDITTTVTMNASSLSFISMAAEAGNPATILLVYFSNDSGSSYDDYSILSEGTLSPFGMIPLSASGAYRITNPATCGTYVVHVFAGEIK